MRNTWLVLAVCAVIILTCTKTPQQIVGTISETDTAMIYNPDNTPAVGAVVRFFAATDSTRTVAWQATTDTKGHYSVKGLAKGSYNMLAIKDTLIVFQDSIVALQDTVLVQPDTLMKSGSITGTIGLQPNHDPRTVTVQVLGTDLYSNVDKDGRFTLSPIAKGNYNLRLVTTLPDYTPTFKTIHTEGQKKDTLTDTLWLVYTGIPVVMGLTASYDTVNGLVHLSWSKASYRDFQDYLVFRDPFDSIVLSSKPVSAQTDTSFVDTVFSRSLTSGQFSFSDTNDYHFKYRVCIENNSTKRGDTYKYVDIVAAQPKKVETSFRFSYFHIAKQFVTDSASINDSLLCSVKISNPTRNLRNLVWTDIVTGKTVRTIALDSTKKTANDSLIYSWNSIGAKGLECVVTDMAGTIWKDTVRIAIVKDAPVVNLTYSPFIIAVNDSIHLHLTTSDKYGKIISIEWDIGNTGKFSASARKDSVIDTAVVAPGSPDSGYLCLVRAADDDGNVTLDTMKTNVGLFNLATDSAGFISRYQSSFVVFNNKMWIIAGVEPVRYGSFSDVWYSSDGTSWSPATQKAPFRTRFLHTSLAFNSKIWVIAGSNDSQSVYNPLGDVWSSSDGSVWDQATSAALFSPRSGHTSVVFNNEMWVIGGEDNSGFKNDVWHSTDGVTWVQSSANGGFLPRSGHISAVFDNKMWVIAGNWGNYATTLFVDDWYSTDGVTWIQAAVNSGFTPCAYPNSVVFDNMIWVIVTKVEPENSPFSLESQVWHSSYGGK